MKSAVTWREAIVLSLLCSAWTFLCGWVWGLHR